MRSERQNVRESISGCMNTQSVGTGLGRDSDITEVRKLGHRHGPGLWLCGHIVGPLGVQAWTPSPSPSIQGLWAPFTTRCEESQVKQEFRGEAENTLSGRMCGTFWVGDGQKRG